MSMNKSVAFFLGSLMLYFGLNWLKNDLPGSYYILEYEGYWDSELHRKVKCDGTMFRESNSDCSEQVVSMTLADYDVKGDLIFALKVDRNAHYSKENCDSCRTLSLPCAEYWVINWKTGERFGPMNKSEFYNREEIRKHTPKALRHSIPQSLSSFCDFH